MPSKRSRPPGLSDGTEVTPEVKRPKTMSRSKAPASKGGRRVANLTSSKPDTKPSPKAKQSSSAPKCRIKVGVDFGTTNSGIAFVMSFQSDAQDVEVIRNWPGGQRNNEQLEKVPTVIALMSENEGMTEDKYGYGVPAGALSYSWFKLLLDADAQKTRFDSDRLTSKMQRGLLELPEDMSAEQVVAAYLSKLYAHLMEVLEKRYTIRILNSSPIDFWFTVPATWQDSAVYATTTAAQEADFGSRDDDTINVITEPEAAAIAVLSVAIEKNPELIKPGKNVLICDLGGGTLDFQVLTITKVKPQLETEETIPGIGGKSGSTYIDLNFFAWNETTFGDAFKKLPKQKTGAGSKYLNDWEIVKKSFTGRDLQKKYQIPLPALGGALRQRSMDSESYDFEDHSVIVTGAEIAKMFEPVVEKAFAIVDQITAALAKEELPSFRIMCLCGGLGSSEYIWAQFRQYVDEKLNGECEIFTDDRAWSAVVRGAAIRGLSGSVVLSKRAKRAYGIAVHREFREEVDDEDDAEDCPIKGKRARGYVHWPIVIGRKFEENMKIKTPLYVSIPEDPEEEDLIFKWKLYSCALEVTPDREEHDDVKKEGTITLDLNKTYKVDKKSKGSKGSHEAVNIAIVFKMGSERGILVVEALHGRKVVGTAKIDYAKTHARQVVSSSAGLLEG